MKVLLHICCGPCAIYCVNRFRQRRDTVEGLFYNPNIHPLSEYIKRRDSAARLSAYLNFKINSLEEYQPEEFFREVVFPERERRCPLCWSMRLERTAEYAAGNGFEGFTTTLLISPYQDHDRIRTIGQRIASRRSLIFIYEDFRSGFKESHRASREMGLYHQNYCGCRYSEDERLKSSENP